MNWYDFEGQEELPSPALVLYLDRIEANLRQMLAVAGSSSRLWPHVKTHKLQPLVARQVELGIEQFKASTVAEAEMCALAGARRVLLAYPVIGPSIERLAHLAHRFPAVAFSCLIDRAETLDELSKVAVTDGVVLGVFLDLDCGMHRTGMAPDAAAVSLYRDISARAGLRADGLHAYDGHLHQADLGERTRACAAAFEAVESVRSAIATSGQSLPRLIAGGSPTFAIHAVHAQRDLSPGTTIFWDFGYGDKFADLPFAPAALVLARVITRITPSRVCVDLGHKAVAAENPQPRVRFIEVPDADFVMHSEEHLVIESPEAESLRIGQVLHGIPRHICPTVALYSEASVVEGGRLVDTWPITARGRRISI